MPRNCTIIIDIHCGECLIEVLNLFIRQSGRLHLLAWQSKIDAASVLHMRTYRSVAKESRWFPLFRVLLAVLVYRSRIIWPLLMTILSLFCI